jgi:hypothetical protein
VKQNELKKVYIGGAILKSFFQNTPNHSLEATGMWRALPAKTHDLDAGLASNSANPGASARGY